MSILEFNRAAGVYQRRSLLVCLVPMGIALACILAYAPLQDRFESYLESNFSTSTADVLAILPVAVPVVLALALIIPLERRTERKAGVVCPHCGRQLAGFKAIVIASRNCPHCGKRVIEERMKAGAS